jgi:hypothetical protein
MGLILDPTQGGRIDCAWVAEVAEFCRSVQDCAGIKSFKLKFRKIHLENQAGKKHKSAAVKRNKF